MTRPLDLMIDAMQRGTCKLNNRLTCLSDPVDLGDLFDTEKSPKVWGSE